MWLVNRRRHDDADDLHARISALTEQRDQARTERDTEREARRIIARQYTEADAARLRTHARNVRLAELLRQAQEEQDSSAYGRMETRLKRMVRAYAECRSELVRKPGADESLIRRLELSERARRSLEQQLLTVQASNDAMCRQLVDLAGNLSVHEPDAA